MMMKKSLKIFFLIFQFLFKVQRLFPLISLICLLYSNVLIYKHPRWQTYLPKYFVSKFFTIICVQVHNQSLHPSVLEISFNVPLNISRLVISLFSNCYRSHWPFCWIIYIYIYAFMSQSLHLSSWYLQFVCCRRSFLANLKSDGPLYNLWIFATNPWQACTFPSCSIIV